MSLINDALKRAQESQRQNAPGALAPLRPVERPIKPQRQSWGWMVSVAVICLIAAAFLFIGLNLAKHTTKPVTASPETPDAVATGTSTTAPTRPVATSVPVTPAPIASETTAQPADSLPVIGPAAIASGNINSEPAKPPLVIQGIVNDPVHPWAIISGRTLYVGDSIRGLRVTAISRNSVTLVGEGKTNRLVVGQAQ